MYLGLEDLKSKRMDLQAVINKEESEKHVLEKHVKMLLDKLTVLNKSLAQHIAMRDNYDRTIKETETGFKKVKFYFREKEFNKCTIVK